VDALEFTELNSVDMDINADIIWQLWLEECVNACQKSVQNGNCDRTPDNCNDCNNSSGNVDTLVDWGMKIFTKTFNSS
jgi:hypothetical protein